ncbi:Stage V sporulation protein S [compost metagenome]
MEALNLRTEVFKVAQRSNPSSLAGAIAARVKESGCCELHAMGPHAANQALKAAAIASGFLAEAGIELIVKPSFLAVTSEGESRTAIRLMIEPR